MTDAAVARYPFGVEATPRPPRRPAGDAELFVLGVYPSALHVRWDLPSWAVAGSGAAHVAALAVADEPTVFWNGSDAAAKVMAWKAEVGFIDGDGPGQWGRVRAAMNGTSGRAVADAVLAPLGVDAHDVWFTDCIDTFFVKTGSAKNRQKAEVMRDVYGPFARAVGRPLPSLPGRPAPSALVQRAATEHRKRLRAELAEAHAPTVVTLGDEAQAVLMAIADEAFGPATTRLTGSASIDADYGRPSTVRVDDHEMTWFALAHPGNRSPKWRARRERWARSVGT